MGIDDVKEFFFKASLATYAGNGEKTTIPELPMSKVLKYQEGRFRYVDLYYVSTWSQQSFGQTTIWYDGVPVWGMQFGGYYSGDVISFLKDALRSAYEAKEFVGGRGHAQFYRNDEGLVYENHVAPNSSFMDFSGEEQVFKNRELMGRHWYRGYSLM